MGHHDQVTERRVVRTRRRRAAHFQNDIDAVAAVGLHDLRDGVRRTVRRLEDLCRSHHTGEIDLPKLESLIRRLAYGSLKHEDVFDDMGHGALMYSQDKFEFGRDDFDVVVTGPRRSMFNLESDSLLSKEREQAP